MSRPVKENVDYFPFLCKEGRAMHYIENKYQNDGFAVWTKLLRMLAVTNNHWLNLNNKMDVMFLSSKCFVTEERLFEIISDLASLGEIDKELWENHRIVWNQKFIDSIQDAYLRRNNKCITYEGLLKHLDSLCIRKLGKGEQKVPVNNQIKEKKTKQNNTKEKNVPTEEEFVKYFIDNGYPEDLGKRAYKGYFENDWRDSQNNPIKNWKSKCIHVWFKESNKGAAGKKNNFQADKY